MSDTRKTHSAEIEADVEDCIATLTDFESHPRWSTPVLRARILSCDERGRGRNVAFELDMRIRRLGYVLEHTYDLPRRISWSLVEGDLASVRGSYEFEPIGPGRTRATCTQNVNLGFWVPGPCAACSRSRRSPTRSRSSSRSASGGPPSAGPPAFRDRRSSPRSPGRPPPPRAPRPPRRSFAHRSPGR